MHSSLPLSPYPLLLPPLRRSVHITTTFSRPPAAAGGAGTAMRGIPSADSSDGRPTASTCSPSRAAATLMAELYRGATPRKPWVAATPCAHLWRAPLPSGILPGIHVLRIRVRDENCCAYVACDALESTS